MLRDTPIAFVTASLTAVALLGCEAPPPPAASLAPKIEGSSMKLASPSFEDQGGIPKRQTCEGEDLSPPLEWSGVPAGAKSLALIVDDPDAPDPAKPQRVWAHWILYNLPPSDGKLAEGVAPADLPGGTLPGRNDWKAAGYRGPCPPVGRHRYVFKLYALDAALPDLREPSKADLERAMSGHVLAVAELVGLYQKEER